MRVWQVAEALYYRVVVRDNGCGMRHEQIPEALGRVLSGSKYGVRQTRGKFGLGAKMVRNAVACCQHSACC